MSSAKHETDKSGVIGHMPPRRLTLGSGGQMIYQRSARVSDPAETTDRRSPAILETFGQSSGSVGRPATAPGSVSGHMLPRSLALLQLEEVSDQ